MKFINKILSLAFVAVMVLFLMSLPAFAAVVGFEVQNGVLVEYVGNAQNVVIPDDAGITEIGEEAFVGNELLESVTIPEGVTSIGDSAFSGCANLTEVKWPSTLLTIERGAFSGGARIANMTLPASVKTIGDQAFERSHLTGTVSLPGVTEIGEYAFSRSAGITDIYMPVVEKLGDLAFGSVTINTFRIPGSLTMDGIGDSALPGDFDTLIICEGVTEIDSGILESNGYPYRNASTVILPSTLKSIRSEGLYHYSNIETLLLPPGMTIIENLPENIQRFRVPATVSQLFVRSVIPNHATAIAYENGYIGSIEFGIRTTSLYIPASATDFLGIFNSDIVSTVYTPEGSPVDAYLKRFPDVTVIHADSPPEDVFGPGYVKTSASDYTTGDYVAPPAGTTPPTTPTVPPTNPITVPVALPPSDKPSAWATAQVNAAIAENLVPSILQSKYNQAITRAEFCALAVALYENVKGEIAGRKEFTDTSDINVQKCAFIGVVSGTNTEQTIFDPGARLTREQAASMLSRLAHAAGKPLASSSSAFSDNGSISSWAAGAVGQVQAAGVMGSTSSATPTFDPKGAYTREQSISTIKRLFDMVK